MKAVTLAASLIAVACAHGPAETPASPRAPAHTNAPVGATGASEKADTTRQYTQADVRFMQTMIGHHAQALDMAALVPTRTNTSAMKLLAERIDVSQRDEIALMKRWLERRGETVPAADAHHHAGMGHGQMMPGMLTQQQMDALAKANGATFDRLFLESMIRHHEGAIEMVEDLLASPGSGQEPELFMFVSDVSADQTAEIKRMQALLGQMKGSR